MRVFVRFAKIGKVWREAAPTVNAPGERFALRRITNRRLKARNAKGIR